MIYFSYFLMTLLMFSGIFLIGLVLLQRGRGGGLAGAFGGMGGQGAFGTKAGDVFTRITIGVATAWILLCAGSVIALHKSTGTRNTLNDTVETKIETSKSDRATKSDSDSDDDKDDADMNDPKLNVVTPPASTKTDDKSKGETTSPDVKKPDEKPVEESKADEPKKEEQKTEAAKPDEQKPASDGAEKKAEPEPNPSGDAKPK